MQEIYIFLIRIICLPDWMLRSLWVLTKCQLGSQRGYGVLSSSNFEGLKQWITNKKKRLRNITEKLVRKRDKVLVTILKDNLSILWSMNLSEWNWREKDFWAGNGYKNPCEFKRNVTLEYYMVTLYLLLFSWHHFHCSLESVCSFFIFIKVKIKSQSCK